MWYILSWSCWNTKEGVLVEPTGAREAKILHRVATGNWGRISVWPSLSPTNWSTARRKEPERGKMNEFMSVKENGAWGLRKKTWNGNGSWVQVLEVLSFRKMNVVLSSPGLQNLEIIKNTRFPIIWRHFVSITVSYNAMAVWEVMSPLSLERCRESLDMTFQGRCKEDRIIIWRLDCRVFKLLLLLRFYAPVPCLAPCHRAQRRK